MVHLAIDDTLTLRASKQAPGSQIHHQHGNNLQPGGLCPRAVLGVTLAMIVQRGDKAPLALGLLSRLIPNAGNTGKLVAANTLMRSVYRLFQGLEGITPKQKLVLAA